MFSLTSVDAHADKIKQLEDANENMNSENLKLTEERETFKLTVSQWEEYTASLESCLTLNDIPPADWNIGNREEPQQEYHGEDREMQEAALGDNDSMNMS
jgi:hypothetical protein